ncbi:ATP synthase subunit C family protein [Candidatus Hydrogenosomobacter endosymbioticus]|uniref:ATP synthase subunit c n=1 Tax=Candidatus Hydrogenosomobacter endosymbioticus TaxID=2558174 RepID=A0ABM7V8C4_9PROT|nr:ATP synthase subunit C family protein [Candidatus Hydrogenosomobacter endosymbioticus]BDB96014.1 hypothetical protein HYD_1470 [Candidatus Hydrogenosomobacter endosymbioticus]
MDVNAVIESSKLTAAAMAVLPLAGVGLGIGVIFNALLNSVARNPEAKDSLFTMGILGAVLAESIGLFALLVSFLILFR